MNTSFKYLILIALIYAICLPVVFAADVITIEGAVYDRATDTQLFGSKVRLLNVPDSTLYAETIADGERNISQNEYVRMSMFTIFDVDRTKKYILEITHAGYKPLYMEIDPATMHRRMGKMSLGKLYMCLQSKTLDEVVVKTSKVMFYNKGDTIISIVR